jgi:hypothetical protein
VGNLDRGGRRNAIEWIALAGAALAALVLGAIGLGKQGATVSDALYGSLQLFVLESNSLESPMPLALEIARWLAPAVAGFAAVRAVLVLFREQFQRMSMRVLMRDHVVIAGLGTKGYTLAIALKQAGYRVVGIEIDERSPAVAGCRRRQIPVVVGDAADRSLLARLRIDRADRLVVLTGEDRRNIDIAFAAQRPPGQAPLNALAHLDELGLWRLLQAEAVAKRARLHLRLDFFNLRNAAAVPGAGRRPAAPAARPDPGSGPARREPAAAHRRALAGHPARPGGGAARHAGGTRRRGGARAAVGARAGARGRLRRQRARGATVVARLRPR